MSELLKERCAGNFVIRKYEDEEGRYIEAIPVGGGMTMKWREDMIVYHLLDSEETDVKGLASWLSLLFSVGQIVDAQLASDMAAALSGYLKRRLDGIASEESSGGN